MLRQIARASVDQLATFLTSPEVAPGSAPAGTEPQVAMASPIESSPEAAGIFGRPSTDPVAADASEAAASADGAKPVPLPRRRTTVSAAPSERETLASAVSSR
jgi:hypothetical protein